MAQTQTTPAGLYWRAKDLVALFRAAGWTEDIRPMQALALGEEVGEYIEALASCAAPGIVAAELADVVIVAYVNAEVFEVDLDREVEAQAASYRGRNDVSIAGGRYLGAARRYLGMARRTGSLDEVRYNLAQVVVHAYREAGEIGIDLNGAIAEKLEVIFARPIREGATA